MKETRVFILIYFLNKFLFVSSGYPPIGDEVQAGSVLLPASRRGRYLANIARRQAVDGTGVHFNKDADRLNAEAKKKVDVLSEELLPYIIAEQERRVTLYRRVMTAIQNGEKGVTIAEIRNKPPLIIRKGLMYRCPTNRAPREPDGSGTIMCEDGIEPSPIVYDSCLSAEDRELFIAENKYFFCNRHRVEGPDYPKNGSVVIACAPSERTSLNYTSIKCALEDTDDVVVHYRYYPDRTYKFVTELDPDREMCEHWNPCQIGYIYSLPSPDTATPANELWNVEKLVPAIAEDSIEEFVAPQDDYETTGRPVPIPEGYIYNGTGKYLTDDGDKLKTYCIVPEDNPTVTHENMEATHTIDGNTVTVIIKFSPYTAEDVGTYYLRFSPKGTRRENLHNKYAKYVNLHTSNTRIQSESVVETLGHELSTSIKIQSSTTTVDCIMIRNNNGTVHNLEHTEYSVTKSGDGQTSIDIHIKEVNIIHFGYYFANTQNAAGVKERHKALTVAESPCETSSEEASTESSVSGTQPTGAVNESSSEAASAASTASTLSTECTNVNGTENTNTTATNTTTL